MKSYNAGNVYIPRAYIPGEGMNAKGLDFAKLSEHIGKMEGSSINAWGFDPDRLLRPKISRRMTLVDNTGDESTWVLEERKPPRRFRMTQEMKLRETPRVECKSSYLLSHELH